MPELAITVVTQQSTRLAHKATRHIKERIIELLLFLAAFAAVGTTVAIIYILVSESWLFFQEVSIVEFVTSTEWTPLFEEKHYGIWALLSGTVVTSAVALSVAVPLGLITAIYLSEFAPHKVRETVKPFLELLEGVPTVVYGYFALLFLTPLLQEIYPDLPGFNMLSAGIIIGIMIIPYVSSVSEDAMRAVPMALREGSYAMGATRFQTAMKVVLPASLSGVIAAFILGISRAVGETMVVAVAAGQQPIFTLNPMDGAATMTSFIVQVAMGDLPHGTVEYQSIFAVGLTLVLITLMFNVIGHLLRTRFREVY
jgi:phosphate transport system permease protein